MNTLPQIQQAISELSNADLQTFSAWFRNYDNERWDRQMADDADAGRLDDLFNEARREKQEGTTKPL